MFTWRPKKTATEPRPSSYTPPDRFSDVRALCECGSIWHFSGSCEPGAYDGKQQPFEALCRDCSASVAVSIPSNTRLGTVVVDKWSGVPFTTLNLRNDTDVPLHLCIEPWASVFPIPPHTTYALHVRGVPHIGGPTIQVATGGITVYPEAGYELRHGDTLIASEA